MATGQDEFWFIWNENRWTVISNYLKDKKDKYYIIITNAKILLCEELFALEQDWVIKDAMPYTILSYDILALNNILLNKIVDAIIIDDYNNFLLIKDQLSNWDKRITSCIFLVPWLLNVSCSKIIEPINQINFYFHYKQYTSQILQHYKNEGRHYIIDRIRANENKYNIDECEIISIEDVVFAEEKLHRFNFSDKAIILSNMIPTFNISGKITLHLIEIKIPQLLPLLNRFDKSQLTVIVYDSCIKNYIEQQNNLF